MLRALGLTGLLLAACASDRPPLLEDDPRSRAGRQAAQRAAQPQPAPQQDPVAATVNPGAAAPVDEAPSLPAARAPFRPPQAEASAETPVRTRAGSGGYAPRAPQVADAPPSADAAAGLDDPYFAAELGAVAQAAPGTSGRPRVGAPPVVGADAGVSAPVQADARPAPAATRRATDEPFSLRGAATPPAPAPRAQAPVLARDLPAPRAVANDAPAAPSAPTAPQGPVAFIDDPQAVLETVNAYRARYGYEPLSYDPLLSQVALDHARDLARRGEVTSVTADGVGVIDRLTAQGYRAGTAASLVSGGYDAFADAMTTWRRDRIQRSRLLLPQAREMGVAYVEDPRSPYRYYIELIVATE